MSLRGIDVSGFQSLAQLARVIDRYAWVGVKATEGLHSSNPLHHAQVALARSRGKGVLHYHYFHPSEDPAAQWAWFRAFSGWRPGDMLALDVEVTDGLPWSTIAARVGQFLTGGRAASGAQIWTYLNLYWRSQLAATGSGRLLEGFPLWLADYTRDPSIFGSARPWPWLACEQWTDNDGGMDGDVFLGDWAAWNRLAVPGLQSTQAYSPIPAVFVKARKGDSMSHIDIVGGSNWREIPVPDDGRTYAVSMAFGGGPTTAGVEFIAFRRVPTVTTPARVSRSGSWPAWQRDVPGRIPLQSNEGCISIRFHGTADQTLSVELYPFP